MRVPQPGGVDRAGAGDPVDAPPPMSEAPVGSGLGYRVQSGDTIEIRLRGISTPQSTVDQVDADGIISMPYLGNIKVAGFTASEIERMVHGLYVPDYYRDATVTVLIPTQRSYYITGDARAPGHYPYIAGVTLLQAISGAGGPSDYANEKRIRIMRGDETLGPYNLVDIQNNPSLDVLIEPGDVIDVPRRIW